MKERRVCSTVWFMITALAVVVWMMVCAGNAYAADGYLVLHHAEQEHHGCGSGSTVHSSRVPDLDTCAVSGCGNWCISGSKYCWAHTCQKEGCNDCRNGNGTIYCNVHARDYAESQGSRICAASRCCRIRETGSEYCEVHTCAKKGCYRETTGTGKYCLAHKSSGSSSGGKSASSSSGKSGSSYGSKSGSTSGSKSGSKSASSGSGKKGKSSAKSYDPYDVYEYDDPEDFYENNYDDFDSFDDAEDYWDEAQ